MKDKQSQAGLGALEVAPLDFTRPASEQIAAALRAAILAMDLVPGAVLPETEVGQRFGASRTPVREAFAQLREEGLIVTWPSRGTVVSRLSVRQIRGAQFLREAIELAVVERLCAQGLPKATQAMLAAVLAGQRDAVARADRLAFQRLDDRFHATLAAALAGAPADAAGLERIDAALTREKAVLDRLRVLSLDDAGHRARLLADHEGIARALAARDGATATARMRQHLRRVLDTLVDMVATHRDHFEVLRGEAAE